jgi:hypothetical protein
VADRSQRCVAEVRPRGERPPHFQFNSGRKVGDMAARTKKRLAWPSDYSENVKRIRRSVLGGRGDLHLGSKMRPTRLSRGVKEHRAESG